MIRLFVFSLLLLLQMPAEARQGPLVPMPYTIHFLPLHIEQQRVQMAYMDVKAERPNGQTVLLLHGKNFNGYYWKQVIPWLQKKGFRVLVPDQVGWGNSSYPIIHYSFHQLACNTRLLLDTLKIDKAIVIGHSMGGMLAVRLALMYPTRVSKLILENPIGLEDYGQFVPYKTVTQQWEQERAATYESYRKYQESYYPAWKPAYDSLVRIQALVLKAPNFKDIAHVNALTYAMIYEQPVCHEFTLLKVPTMLVIGQEDRTVVGKALLTPEQREHYGQYPALGQKAAALIPGAQLVALPGVGHIPHIQDFDAFSHAIEEFIDSRQ